MNSRRGVARCGCARAAAGARRKDALLYRRGCSGSAPPPADPAPRRLPGAEVPARCARPQGEARRERAARHRCCFCFITRYELSIYKRFVQSTQAALCFTHRASHVRTKRTQNYRQPRRRVRQPPATAGRVAASRMIRSTDFMPTHPGTESLTLKPIFDGRVRPLGADSPPLACHAAPLRRYSEGRAVAQLCARETHAEVRSSLK